MEKTRVFVTAVIVVLGAGLYAAAPKVVQVTPQNGQLDVSPELQAIRIEFDQPMSRDGFSICGSGPKFPAIVGEPRWVNSRTFAMRVKLAPDTEYEFSINCPSGLNFKNAQGESAEVYPVAFKTGAAGQAPAAAAAGSAKSNPAAAALLQKARHAEDTEGDLDKAIGLYEQVLVEAAEVERLAAQATYQLGMCHLKKGEPDAAVQYFKKVVSAYSSQRTVADKAAKQLEQLVPKTRDSVFEQIDGQAIRFLAEQFGKTASDANQQHLAVNSHVSYVDPEGYRYSGGMNAYYNWTGRTITQKTKLCGMSGSDYTFYDATGEELTIEFEKDAQSENFYQVYWNPKGPLAPEEYLYYGWSSNSKQKLPKLPGGAYSLTMQNQYGDPVIETFFLVLPKGMKISDSTPPTGKENLLNFTVYWWTKQMQQGENHVETVSLMSLREASPDEIAKLVDEAVLTISTCAETDPRVKTSLDSLAGVQEGPVVAALSAYLGEEAPTVRRAAIFILWRGAFSDISAASPKLIELCGHSENFTRGMAALALGGNKVAGAYDALVKMTLEDEDAFARRCGAYALGLLGDAKALPVLEQALQDKEDLVKQNAQAAITMLTKLNATDEEASEPDPTFTQEGYGDIQADGTIRFRSPNRIVNRGTEPITEERFINSDFVNLTTMTDEQGRPVEFTAVHEGRIYRYHVRFNPPILPGETFVYYMEGTTSGLIKPIADQADTYRYYMTHSPSTGQPTLRIESFLLPPGAEVLSMFPAEMQRGEKDGRIELRVEKVIPANGSMTTSFTYRLEK